MDDVPVLRSVAVREHALPGALTHLAPVQVGGGGWGGGVVVVVVGVVVVVVVRVVAVVVVVVVVGVEGTKK